MKTFFNTQINSFTDVTYGHLFLGLVIVAAIVSYVIYNIVKTEKNHAI